MENPQRVIYARAILVAGSCPVSQTLSTPSPPPSRAKEEEEKSHSQEKEDESGSEEWKKKKKRRRGWRYCLGDSSCRGYNATLKYRRKYKEG